MERGIVQHLLGQKNKVGEANLAGRLPSRVPMTHYCLPHSAHSNPPNRCHPLSVGVANVFMEKHIAWMHRTWKNVCSALPKRGSQCAEEVFEPEFCTKESSSQVKCNYHGKLEVLPSFERHILLCMLSKQPLRKERGSLRADNHTLFCNCEQGNRPSVGGENLDDVCVSSAGIFLQAYVKDDISFAHKLMDAKWMRRPLQTLAFARLRGESGMMYANAYQSDNDFDDILEPQLYQEESVESSLVTFCRISVRALKERMGHAVSQQQMENPDKEMLDSVQDFFMYTEFEGKQVFEELDRDADGKLTIDDVRLAMKKMKLPANYAKDFMQSKHWPWPKKHFRWSEFSSMIQEKEPLIIKLFNSLGVSKSGTVSRTHVRDSLKKAGLSATEANVSAMMRILAADTGECIKYGQFRRFMLLLPTEQLSSNPWSVWLEAATMGGIEPSSETLQDSVLKYMASLSRIGSKQERFKSEATTC